MSRLVSSAAVRRRRQLTGALLVLVLTGVSSAETGLSDDQMFVRGVGSLDKGAVDDAIDTFEALADRGFVHPDASYNRAVA